MVKRKALTTSNVMLDICTIIVLMYNNCEFTRNFLPRIIRFFKNCNCILSMLFVKTCYSNLSQPYLCFKIPKTKPRLT